MPAKTTPKSVPSAAMQQRAAPAKVPAKKITKKGTAKKGAAAGVQKKVSATKTPALKKVAAKKVGTAKSASGDAAKKTAGVQKKVSATKTPAPKKLAAKKVGTASGNAASILPQATETQALNLSMLPADVFLFDVCASLSTQSVLTLHGVCKDFSDSFRSSLKFWRTRGKNHPFLLSLSLYVCPQLTPQGLPVPGMSVLCLPALSLFALNYYK
jgi:hypothetical protein